MKRIYDMLVIGGGPAGYTTALYAARAGLDTLVLEKMLIGGQMTQTQQIDNYPGFDEGIKGFVLGEKMKRGAERFGAETKLEKVVHTDLIGDIKKIETVKGEFLARTVVVATGAHHKHLGIEKEDEYAGSGVAYCAMCDGMLYKGKTVAIVGGGNSAAADATLLSRICEKVVLIHRRDSLRATKIYHDQLMNLRNIEFKWNSKVSELLGEDKISGIKIKNVNTGNEEELRLDCIFISIGRSPETSLFTGQLELDNRGYIIADESTKTNISGVFAVGDVRTKALRQVITAESDGAVAAYYAEEYIAKTKK